MIIEDYYFKIRHLKHNISSFVSFVLSLQCKNSPHEEKRKKKRKKEEKRCIMINKYLQVTFDEDLSTNSSKCGDLMKIN